MRVLILSQKIRAMQSNENTKYRPRDIDLDVCDINYDTDFNFSIYDYDVSIIHILKPSQISTTGYAKNLMKLHQGARLALENGRTIICLAGSSNFSLDITSSPYNWIKELGIVVNDGSGTNIKPTGVGNSQIFKNYFSYVTQYFQKIEETISSHLSTKRIAVIRDTNIVVGIEITDGNGNIVILPPPDFDKNYILIMSYLMEIARYYKDRAMKSIPVGDEPDWLQSYLIPRAIELQENIKNLSNEKSKLDRIAYILYGTGEILENSIELVLQELGLIVESQPKGANIDFKAMYPAHNLSFAIEVTGTKGTIQKKSNKVSQAWTYIGERDESTEENTKLIIIANTENHLNPSLRNKEPFTSEVVKLIKPHNVLLITTLQLYDLWKGVNLGNKKVEDVIHELYEKSGCYQP